MQYSDPFQGYNQGIRYIDGSYCQQDAATIDQLRQERQPQILILTIVSPELHFDAAVGLCVEGTIREVCDVTT